MFDDILGKKGKKLPKLKASDIIDVQPMYRWSSDDPDVMREIFEFDHKSNKELLDMYFMYREACEDPSKKGWRSLLKEDLYLIEEEIFNR